MNKQFPMGTLVGDPLPGAPELAARGHVVTGVRTLQLIEPNQPQVQANLASGDRVLKVEVWYPAKITADSPRAFYMDHMGRSDLANLKAFRMEGRAYRDAAPDDSLGPAPVVVISHGYPGSRFLLLNLAENLASKGYVVFSIGHTDNTYEDFLPQGSLESAIIHRSQDQRFVISQLPRLNREGFLQGMLQPENVGLIGFSMGGYGALRTIGARMSEAAIQQFSSIREHIQEPEDFHGLKAVRAAILFAPATFWFDEEKSGDIDIPTLWFCGSADETVHYQQVHSFWEKATASERRFITYENCGHNVANNPAPMEARAESWEIYKRWADPVWDTWRLNNANCHFATAFFDKTLRELDMNSYLDEMKGFVDGGGAGIGVEKNDR